MPTRLRASLTFTFVMSLVPPAGAKICLTCGNDVPLPPPAPIPVIVKQTVIYNFLPIAVIYAPPGVCNGNSDCPSQKLKSSDSFSTSLTLTNSSGTTNSGSASATVSGGLLGQGVSASVSFSSSATHESETTNQNKDVVVNVSQLTASLRPTDDFRELLSVGAKRGNRDVITFFEFPMFDVFTQVGTVVPFDDPVKEEQSFKKLDPPITVSVVPNFSPSFSPFCPDFPGCRIWTQRAVTVEQIQTQLAGGDGGIPELSRDDLLRLLRFDPMTLPDARVEFVGVPERFVEQPISYAWTPCDSQFQPEVSKTTSTSSSQKDSSSTTTKVNASFSIGGSLVPFAEAKFTIEAGRTSTWGHSRNKEMEQIHGTNANASFGGNGVDTGACGDPILTRIYIDSVSGSLAFDTQDPTLPPSGVGFVATCFEDETGSPISNAAMEVSPASGSGTSLPAKITAITNGQGCLLMTLAAGNYAVRRAGFPAGAADTPLRVVASDSPVFTRFPTTRIASRAAGQPAALRFDLPPPSVVTAGDPLRLKTSVSVLDGDGKIVSSYNGPVSVALARGTGTAGGTLSGPATVNARSGIAVFSNLSVSLAGNGYRLNASIDDPPLSTLSAPFDVRLPPLVVGGIPGVPPSVSIASVTGITAPSSPSGSVTTPDIVLPASAGASASVVVETRGLPRSALIQLFLSRRIGGRLLPAVNVGSRLVSGGAAVFTVSLPTPETNGSGQVIVLQARAVGQSVFTTANTLRPSRVAAGTFLASSAPVSARTASATTPANPQVSIVGINEIAPAILTPGGARQALLPPGTNSGAVSVDLAFDPGIAEGTPVTLVDGSGATLASGTVREGGARLPVQLPPAPSEGSLPITTLRAVIGTDPSATATETVQATIRRGFVDAIQASPVAGGLTISWVTDPASASAVRITDPDGTVREVNDALQQEIHRVTVTGLKPLSEHVIHITASHPPLDPWTADAAATSGPKPGDLDDDGKIAVTDAVQALRIAVSLLTPTEDQLLAGDLDEVGRISVTDVVTILRAALGVGGE